MHSVNDEFPPFKLNGVDSNQDMVTVSSQDLEGWRVFYFYPKDFTFICPTEISAMDKVVEAVSYTHLTLPTKELVSEQLS